MRKDVQWGIGARLTVFASTIVFLVVGAMTLYTLSIEKDERLALLQHSSMQMQHLLANAVANNLYFLDVHALRQQLAYALVHPEIRYARVLDAQGEPLVNLAQAGFTPAAPPLPEQVRARWSPGPVVRADGESTLVVAGAVRLPDGSGVGFLELGFSLEGLAQEVRQRVRTYLGAALVALLAGALLACIMAVRISRPIKAIARVAQSVGKGVAPPALDVRRRDEIGALADAVNTMAMNLARITVSRDYMDTVINTMGDMLIVTNEDLCIRQLNQAALLQLGYGESELIDRSIERLTDDGRLARVMRDKTEPGLWQRGWETRFLCADGRVIEVLFSVARMNDPRSGGTLFILIGRDISELKRTQQDLDYLAHHDTLTGLPNRLMYHEQVERAIRRARRNGSQMAILFLDLDRFKYINDTLGHPVGDQVLSRAAHMLQDAIRDKDVLARMGGDEFTVLLEDLVSPESAAEMALRLLEKLNQRISYGDQTFYLDASIGISLYPQDGRTVEALVKKADTAMYKAKERGSNHFQFYTEELTNRAAERFQVERALRQALENGEFELYYQPQVRLRDGTLIGAEALIRWHHPHWGLVSPARFVPIAEQSGLIVPIGDWVLQEACRQFSAWRAQGVQLAYIAVNVAAPQMQPALMESVQRALHDNDLQAEQLELEVTENFIMSEASHALDVLEQLRTLGLALAIDDFGTGYSSLSYLKRLPFTRLKIDQSFVRELEGSADDAAIVNGIIAIGKGLGMELVAEGIESAAQRDCLLAQGCEQGQGYFYAPPITADAFLDWAWARQGMAAATSGSR